MSLKILVHFAELKSVEGTLRLTHLHFYLPQSFKKKTLEFVSKAKLKKKNHARVYQG
jgi:hypothetical protein